MRGAASPSRLLVVHRQRYVWRRMVLQFSLLRFWLGTGVRQFFRLTGGRGWSAQGALLKWIFNGGTGGRSSRRRWWSGWYPHGWRGLLVQPNGVHLGGALAWTYRPNPEGSGWRSAQPTVNCWDCVRPGPNPGRTRRPVMHSILAAEYSPQRDQPKEIGLFARVPFHRDIAAGGGWFAGWLIVRGYPLHQARKIDYAQHRPDGGQQGWRSESIPLAFILICTAMFGHGCRLPCSPSSPICSRTTL